MASSSKSSASQKPGKPEQLSNLVSDPMLPKERVRIIVNSCPDLETVHQESLYLIAKATELFVQYLTQEIHSHATDASTLCYDDVAKTVHTLDQFKFLREAIPHKITWAEAQKLMENSENKFEGFC